MSYPNGKYRTYCRFGRRVVVTIFTVNLLTGWIGAVYAQVEAIKDSRTGIELLGRSANDPPPATWSVYETGTGKKVAQVGEWKYTQNQGSHWGFTALPPGEYRVAILPSGYGAMAVDWAEVTVIEGQVARVEVNSGIELVGRSDADPPPAIWAVHDAQTNKQVAQVGGHEAFVGIRDSRWGFTPLPPGEYILGFLWERSRGRTGEVVVVEVGTVKKLTLSDLGFGKTPAALVHEIDAISGFNIALAALGGRIESATSQNNDSTWAASNLIDGFTFLEGGRSCRPTCGWKSDGTFPHEIVFSFHRGREALITAVIIDPTTEETRRGYQHRIPQHVEVWTSTASPTDGFVKTAAARLQLHVNEQAIIFPPARAKFVKLRILSDYQTSDWPNQMGEVKIIEAPEGTSILHDLPRDLALPANGGAIVRFTSQYEHSPASNLVSTGGWRSDRGPYGSGSYLPQDVVFAFRGDQVAYIDRIILDSSGVKADSFYPPAKTVAVHVSTEGPLEGFEKVGEFALSPEPGEQAFPIDRKARFVKLRILEAFTPPRWGIQFGKVKLIEGSPAGYVSILRRPSGAPEAYRVEVSPPLRETGIAVESEPNNMPTEANPLELGLRTKGFIDPLGENDYFRVSLPEGGPSILTTELSGRPHIRTSLTLFDSAGNTLYQLDPKSKPGPRTTFSLRLHPGDYLVHVTEPIISMVLIWDTSGSMEGRSKDLQEAMYAYLDQVQPTERLNLIAFSDTVNVLLPEFTGDRESLKSSIRDRFTPAGGTSLYDAIANGIELLENAEGNRAIVVMTDGLDTSSKLSHAGFWKRLSEKRIRVYTIGLGKDLEEYRREIGSTGERMLGHVALATNGRSYFARTSEELKGLYQAIADELRMVSTYYLRPELSRNPGMLNVVSTGDLIAGIAAPRFALIFDASGSMRDSKRKIENKLKIEVAKDVMFGIIDELPTESEVALRVYGHRVREYDKGDCEDSELFVDFQKIDKEKLKKRIDGIQVKSGTTPLTYSLVQAAKDLADTPGDKTIVLVTDGEEYCGAIPHEVAAKLAAYGMTLRVEIVGFALADPKVKEEMVKAAKATGGSFHDAQDAESLRQSLRQALAARFDVLDVAGNRVGAGVINRGPIEVPQGVYTVIVRAGDAPIEFQNVGIVQDAFTQIRLEKQGEEIGREAVGPAKSEDARWAVKTAAQPLQAQTPAPGSTAPVPNLNAALDELEREVLAAIVNRPKPGSRAAPTTRSGPDPRIREAQAQLAKIGFDPGPSDGLWGSKTKSAVAEFQRQRMKQTSPTGQLDDSTYAALRTAVADGWRAGQESQGVSPGGAPSSAIEEAMKSAYQPEWERRLTNAPSYLTTKLTPALRTPSARAKIIAHLSPGTKVKVLGEIGNYLEVAWENRSVVFVLRKDMVRVDRE